MNTIIILVTFQIFVNVIIDKTGLSKKYFSSSGGFLFVVFCALWILFSLPISNNLFPDSFQGDFAFFTFWPAWIITLVIGPLLILIVQLLYSYLIRRLVIKK
ncbi:MAG: hypothetical protein ACXVPU_05005 [Bacteroidia bacterium]